MRGRSRRSEGLGKKENSEVLRILLFSDNWNMYDKYMYIHGHWVLESMFVPVWPRIFTEMWSNFRMRFVITPFWILMKSFQKSPEMPVITCILLSPPWTDRWGSPQRNCFRVVFTDQDVGCNDTGFVEHLHWFWGADERTLSLTVSCRQGFHQFWVAFQSTGYLHVQSRWLWAPAWYISQLYLRK